MVVKATRMTRTTVEVLAVLLGGALNGEDLHGLEVCRRTGLKSGTVYPILDRLHRAGWVITWWEKEEAWQGDAAERWRPRRRYYQLSNAARQPSVEAIRAHRPTTQQPHVGRGLGDIPGTVS